MKQVKEIYNRKFNEEWKSSLNVGSHDLGWQYLQHYLAREKNTIEKKVLDLGCGNGQYSHMLLSHGMQNVYGMDLFEEVPFKEERFCYHQGDINQKLPYADNFFDMVFAQSVLYYAVDLEKTIQEIKRILKPNGILYISCHTKYSIYTLSRRIKLKFRRKTVEHLQGVRFYPASYYERVLEMNAFSILKVDGWGIYLFDTFFRICSGAAKVLHAKYKDPRKEICKNCIWCKFKSIVGYHFIVIGQNSSKEHDL